MARIQAVVLPDEPSDSHRKNAPKFEIFINHRGPDIKNSFVAHLFDALCRKHYTTFLDRDGIRKGEMCFEEIQSALEGASIQLAIFTPRYAESKYCLNELIDMLRCSNNNPEKVKLVPVFFNVKPGDLRRVDAGPFQKAFQDHATKASALVDDQQRNEKQEKIKKWKDALLEAASRDGFEFSSMTGDENILMHKIVDQVESILGSRIVRKQPVSHCSVGLETPFIHIEGELEKMRDKVTILGIWGMGGIGKTTLAKELYNRCTEKYELYAFVEIGGAKSMEDLQKQVLYDLLGWKEENIRERYNGLFEKVGGRRVLLVIDNISKAADFFELVPNIMCLGIGSRVIVTSRDQHELKVIVRDSNSFYLHEMQVLNFDASHQLFRSHASESHMRFSSSNPQLNLANRIVGRCGGLPLALVIIGKHLCGKQKDVWEEVAVSMETRFEVLDVLSISYWGLSKSEKTMFLDVSCQMIGMLEEDAIDIWKSCSLGSESGNPCRRPLCWTSSCVRDSLSILKDKALVTVDSEKKLTMHDLLQDMGKWVVGMDSIGGALGDLEEHSHLWNFKDARVVLEEAQGAKRIRGLSLATGREMYEELIWATGRENTIPVIDASKFQKMSAIHLLQLDNARIEGDFSKWSSYIRWLKWRRCSLRELPSGLHFPFLIHLDLSSSLKLTRLWSADDDTQVPRFLRVLNLEKCYSLKEIPENIKFLTKLKRLNLRYCVRLRSLPSSLGQLIELEELDVLECCTLETLPSDIVNLSRLKVLSSKTSASPDEFVKLTLRILDQCSEDGSSSQLVFLENYSLSTTAGIGPTAPQPSTRSRL